MNEEYIAPVILCGGTGTRLWPLSRESFPKQYLKLLDLTLRELEAATSLRLTIFLSFNNPRVTRQEPPSL